jgi:hypothetical protein
MDTFFLSTRAMDAQLFARKYVTAISHEELDWNRVWVHPSVAKGSKYCTAFFNGKQAVFAIGTNKNIHPTHFVLPQTACKHLTCDYTNARVYFKDVYLIKTPSGRNLILDLQIANIYKDEKILNDIYDADQMRCEMYVLFDGTVFEAGRKVSFTHRDVLFLATPREDFVFFHKHHTIQLTHAFNTCFNVICDKGSDAIANNTPYLDDPSL